MPKAKTTKGDPIPSELFHLARTLEKLHLIHAIALTLDPLGEALTPETIHNLQTLCSTAIQELEP